MKITLTATKETKDSLSLLVEKIKIKTGLKKSEIQDKILRYGIKHLKKEL